MAIRAISLKPTEYVSISDNPEDPTIWLIKGLTRLEWMELENSLQSQAITMDDSTDKIKTISNTTNAGTFNKLLVDFGLVGWKNFKDENGKDIEFSEQNKDLIPKDVREELAGEISKLTSVKAKLAKN